MRGRQTCSGQNQRVNTLSFAGHMVSVVITQLYHDSGKSSHSTM